MYIFSESTYYRPSNNVWHHIFQKSIASQPKLKAWKEPDKVYLMEFSFYTCQKTTKIRLMKDYILLHLKIKMYLENIFG